jgi:hypothetical protein
MKISTKLAGFTGMLTLAGVTFLRVACALQPLARDRGRAVNVAPRGHYDDGLDRGAPHQGRQ